jgi:C_GCAxxG_C_C family probable redox protein
MSNREIAIQQFKTMNCNQSVISVFGPQFGVPAEVCFNMGLAFGGGMGRQGKICGAVTGAYMAIGLWSAGQSTEIKQQKKLAVEKVAQFNRLFVEKHGSLDCKALLKYDLSIPDEAEKAAELGLFDSICPELVGSSAEIITKILV